MTDESGSPRSSPRRLGAAFLGLLHSHVELLGIELQEQKARTVSLLLFAGLALVFGLLLLIGLSALVMILLWDSYRISGILGLCVFYTLAAVFCGVRLKAAVTAAEDYVQSNPWQSVGIAAGVGFLIGLLATRR